MVYSSMYNFNTFLLYDPNINYYFIYKFDKIKTVAQLRNIFIKTLYNKLFADLYIHLRVTLLFKKRIKKCVYK